MIEPEVAFNDLNANALLAEGFLKFIIRRLLDQHTEDLVFFSKENEGPVRVFVAHPPLSLDAPTTLEQIATLPGGGSLANSITAADISSDGSAIVVRTPDDVLHDWRDRHGLGDVFSEATIGAAQDRIERELQIQATDPAIQGPSSATLLQAPLVTTSCAVAQAVTTPPVAAATTS